VGPILAGFRGARGPFDSSLRSSLRDRTPSRSLSERSESKGTHVRLPFDSGFALAQGP